MPNNLTAREKKVVSYIENYIAANSLPPNLFEVMHYMHYKSMSPVHNLLRSLESKGALQRNYESGGGIFYALKIGEYVGRYLQIPMVGSVVAGVPLISDSDITETIEIDIMAENLEVEPDFALRIRGYSMKDANFFPEDVIMVKSTNQAIDGDLVVAILPGGEATMKYYFLEPKNQIRLEPANNEFSSMYFTRDDVQVQGIVIGKIENSL